MHTLILPDIHLQWEKVDKIIKHEAADQIVFLGDYFDDWNDNAQKNEVMAQWLVNSLQQPNRIHLMGNHDIGYAIHHRSYQCSGYEYDKDIHINNVMCSSPNINWWKKIKLFTWIDNDWLCSHAGVHKHFYDKYNEGKSFNVWIEDICNEAMEAAYKNQPELPILRAGRIRGGVEMYGGITWCDYREFIGIPQVNQIFGHTPNQKPVWLEYDYMLDNGTKTVSKNLALDNFGHCNYYAVYNHKVKTIDIKWIGDM
jgi:Calcineurin-like phosphoesterase